MIRTSIRRPVAVAMAYMAVGLLGAFAWQNIPIELLPNTELPRLQVQANWPGASPETVEAFLTSPIEAAIQKVQGVEKINSQSYENQGMGQTEITVEFNREVDMDFVRLDLSERLSTLEEELPPGAGNVSIQPYVPREFRQQAERSFLRYTFTGPITLEALRAHIEDVVVPELAQIEGVALVDVYGGRDRLMEIELDEDKITSLGLSVPDIWQRIADLDLVREAGVVRAEDREWTVTIRNRPASVLEVRDAILASSQGSLIRVSDVARVRDTYEEARSLYRINGRPAVQFVVVKEIGTNTVRVADRVKSQMEQVERRNPAGARFILDEDESEDIERQLTDLRSRAIVSAVVIFAVLLVFLRSIRSAAMIFATIAFSILIALNIIYFAGLSLNLLTLMGLAMGFGLIVDNSIVVLENVFRRWQAGDPPEEAAETGARQVVLPILAATATTLIVLVPFVYLKGELRIFYVPLAVVVGFTLLASLFVAFTFIPALSAKILGVRGSRLSAAGAGGVVAVPGQDALMQRSVSDPDGTPAGGQGSAGGGSAAAPEPTDRSALPGGRREPLYIRFYRELVGFTLRHPWLAVSVAVLAFGGSYYLFDKYVDRGVIWGGGWGQRTYIDVRISLPRGSDLERTDQLARYFEEKLAAMPEPEQFVTRVNGTWGNIRVTFPEALENTQIPVAIKEQMVAHSLEFSGADVRVYGYGPSFYGGGGGAPNYSIMVLGYNYEQVREIAENLGTRLTRMSRIQDVDTNASGYWYDRDKATEFVVTIDRSALARYDMSVQEFVQRMGAAVRGQVNQNMIKIGGEELRYEVKLEGYRDTDLVELRETIISSPSGTALRLGDVVSIAPREILSRIRRENQQYERRVAYEFRGPRKLGDLVHEAVIEATEVPPGYTVKKADSWRWSTEEATQIYMVLIVSILLVYMVTSALFESLRQPLCVLLTVPMALIGVFLIFFYAEASFTREAYVGVIMMGGIVVNNAILLVDHINHLRREGGLALEPAILQGTLERVRPILMTTTTTVLGLLPLVLFSEAADANIWNALAFALIGGLLSSTLFVLTTTPALYLLFERLGRAKVPVASTTPPDAIPVGAD